MTCRKAQQNYSTHENSILLAQGLHDSSGNHRISNSKEKQNTQWLLAAPATADVACLECNTSKQSLLN
jgi:hypothetical protein